MELHLTSTSAIPLSQYRNWGGQKVFDKQKYEEMFLKWTGRRNAYRIYLPVDAALNERRKIRVPKDINKAVVDAGYEVTDYIQGIVTDKQKGTNRRLGKFLNKLKRPDLVKMFESDPLRKMHNPNRTKMLVVVSRHPYDIAGMSTGRSWRSCTNLEDGINKHYVIDDVKKGSLVAYLVRANDKNINNPIARTRILRYSADDNPNDFILLPQGDVYGQDNVKFLPTLNKWLDEINDASTVDFHEADVSYTDGKKKLVRTLRTKKDLELVRELGHIEYRFANKEIAVLAIENLYEDLLATLVKDIRFDQELETALDKKITKLGGKVSIGLVHGVLHNKTVSEEFKFNLLLKNANKYNLKEIFNYDLVSLDTLIGFISHVKENDPKTFSTFEKMRITHMEENKARALLDADLLVRNAALKVNGGIPEDFISKLRRTSEVKAVTDRSGLKRVETAEALIDLVVSGNYEKLEQDAEDYTVKDLGKFIVNVLPLEDDAFGLLEHEFTHSEEAFSILSWRVVSEDNAETLLKAIKSSGIGKEYIKNFASALGKESLIELKKTDPIALLSSFIYDSRGHVKNKLDFSRITELLKSLDASEITTYLSILMKAAVFSLKPHEEREAFFYKVLDKMKELNKEDRGYEMYKVINEISKVKVIFVDERREMFLNAMLDAEYDSVFYTEVRCQMLNVLSHESNVMKYIIEPSDSEGWKDCFEDFIGRGFSTRLWKEVLRKLDHLPIIKIKNSFKHGNKIELPLLKAMYESNKLTKTVWQILFENNLIDYGTISDYLNQYPYIAGLFFEQKEDVPVDEYMDYLEDFMFTIHSDKLEEMKASLPERAKDILESEPERYDLNV